MRTRAATLAVAGVLLLGACSDDGDSGSAATSTSSLDPGVTFEDITVPTTPDGQPSAATVPVDPDDVEVTPRQEPRRFPEDFPRPEGATVEMGSVGHAPGELRLAVDYSIDEGDPFETYDSYLRAIDQGGWPVLLDDSDGEGQDFIGQIVFETDTYIGNVLVSGDGGSGALVTLTATLPE